LEQTNKLNVKIAKTATQKSIMDVTASLDYRKVNAKNEDVYKGSVIFSITEMQSGNYERAWVSKAKAKMLMHAMVNHDFEQVFGANGFTDYGGTVGPNPRARILNVKMSPKKQFIFTINEGPGKVGENGSIQMAGKPEKTVQTYIAFHEGLQLAHEVYDYIRDEETKAMIAGKPLYTVMPYQAQPMAKEKITEKKEYKPTGTTPTAEQLKEKLAKMTESQLKSLFEKIKESTAQKDLEMKKMIAEDMRRRKAEKTAG